MSWSIPGRATTAGREAQYPDRVSVVVAAGNATRCGPGAAAPACPPADPAPTLILTGCAPRAPASSANLGPGFDTLAVALDRAMSRWRWSRPAPCACTARAKGRASPDNALAHLAARVAAAIIGHDRFAVTRALADTGLPRPGVAGRPGRRRRRCRRCRRPLFHCRPLGRPSRERGRERLRRAGGRDHRRCDKARAAITSSPCSDELAFVVIVPDRPLVTAEARAVLPDTVTLADALFNLGRMGCFMRTGLAEPDASSRRRRPPTASTQGARATFLPGGPGASRRTGGGWGAGGLLVRCGTVPVGDHHRVVGRDERSAPASKSPLEDSGLCGTGPAPARRTGWASSTTTPPSCRAEQSRRMVHACGQRTACENGRMKRLSAALVGGQWSGWRAWSEPGLTVVDASPSAAPLRKSGSCLAQEAALGDVGVLEIRRHLDVRLLGGAHCDRTVRRSRRGRPRTSGARA